MSVIIAFSRTLLGGYDSQVYIQERAAVCRVWGMGVYSIFMNMHVCVSLCAIPFNSRAVHRHSELRSRQCFISDSCNVNKVGMVNRKSVGWRRGKNGPRPWEVSEQAADNDDVITHDLTAGDLTGSTSL